MTRKDEILMLLRLLDIAAFPMLLCGAGDPPLSTRQKEKGSPAQEPNTADITKLVKQLASPVFAERAAASKTLEAIGLPALGALRKAAKDNDAEVARRAAQLVAIIENSLDQLLEDYLAYGLPLPPKDAKLVRFESCERYMIGDKLMPPTHFLGFLLRPGLKDQPALLLVGTQELRLDDSKKVEIVEPSPKLVKRDDLLLCTECSFEANEGLAVALQCKARGWNDLAQALWSSSIEKNRSYVSKVFDQRANLGNRTAVAYLAWAYSENELVRPNTDRSKIAKRMRALLATEPGLRTQTNESLMRSLEAALVPSKGKPGTVERFIDDLTDMCNADRSDDDRHPSYFRLAAIGFAAVPALIEHLDDERLTRTFRRGSKNFQNWIMRVQDVVSDLLQELAGADLSQDWLRRNQGWSVEKADAKAWWEKAQKESEEAYLLHEVIPLDERRSWLNRLMLDLIRTKYPQHLPTLYRKALDKYPNLQSWPIAEAVAKSSLSDDKKRELFSYASHNKDLEKRRYGLTQLQVLDPKQFITILLATLEGLPKTPTEPYWSCPEVGYAHVVMDTDDARAWMMLEKVAKRSDVALRMQFLSSMRQTKSAGRQRELRLNFLASFLEDAEARDVKSNPTMFEGPHAGFLFDRLAVRDLAAMEIAFILEMPDSPDKTWTPEQWKKLRDQAKARLKK
jgi:hypothetical protein